MIVNFQKLKKLKSAVFKSVKKERVLMLGLLLLSTSPVFAQAGGGAIGDAATTVKSYLTNVVLLIKAVGVVVGVVGALRIYNKWSNGDQDINKEVVGWAGACLFLILAPDFVQAILA